MNLFLTKETAKKYNIKEITKINDLENKTIFDWAGKIFYSGGKKGILLMNIESRITLFLFQINVKDMKNLEELVFKYLHEIYKDNLGMRFLITKYEEEAGKFEYGYIKDRSALGNMNCTEIDYFNPDILEKYVTDKRFDEVSFNLKLNKHNIFSKIENGKKNYIYSYEKFEEELKKYFCK